MVTFTREVRKMVKLIRWAAANEILPRFGNVEAVTKGNYKYPNLVTAADIESSKSILDIIQRQFPGSYSEEHLNPTRFDYDLLWQLDTVDGTYDFSKGKKEGYATMVALLQRQPNGTYASVASIVYVPGADRMWYSDGKDVIFEDQGIITPIPEQKLEKLLCGMKWYEENNTLKDFYYTLGESLGLEVEIVPTGASGSTVDALLNGRIHVCASNIPNSKDWDAAPADALLRGLGGYICSTKDEDFTFNQKNSPGYDEPFLLDGYVMSIEIPREKVKEAIPENFMKMDSF